MARYNVEYNGKWACYSTICDDFIKRFTTKHRFEKWRKKEYGERIEPLEMVNQMDIEDAIGRLMARRIETAKVQKFGYYAKYC
ncbi:MAG: hypothetical protein LBC84_09270 [Prevotellaceae bacterium]|jgi:hypothetical protein|nr:hypothetical protein [Prevotellaceae bacterium]